MKKSLLSLLVAASCAFGAMAQDAPNLQSSYPMPMTKVSEIPDNIILMFDQEITSVDAAALQSGYDDPIMIAEDKVTVLDGNSVYLNVTDLKESMAPGNITAFAMVNGIDAVYEVNFILGAEFGIVESSFTAEGGQLLFSQFIDFDPEAETTVEVYNAGTEEVVTTADLLLNDDLFEAVDIVFAEPITADGEYFVRIPGETIISVEGDVFEGGDIAFIISQTVGIASLAPVVDNVAYNAVGQRVNGAAKGFAIKRGKVTVNTK